MPRKKIAKQIVKPGDLKAYSDADLQALLAAREQSTDGSRHLFYLFEPYRNKGSLVESFQFSALLSDCKTIAVLAGNRCVSGDTVVASDGRTIRELVWSGVRSFPCRTFDGAEIVDAVGRDPFLKGVEQLYRVELSNGKSFEATGAHRVLAASGDWVSVHAMRQVCARGLPVSILGSVRSARGEGDRRSIRTASGSSERCSLDSRRCDEQPRVASGFARATTPSRGCAQERSAAFDRVRHDAPVDDQGGTQARSRSCQGHGRQSSSGGQHRPAAQFVASSIEASCTDVRSVPSTPRSDQRLFGSSTSSLPRDHEEQLHRDQSARAWESPVEVRVNRIVPSRVDSFYDFTVPGTKNYVAAGVIHHNTGKTQLGCRLVAARLMGFDPFFDGVRDPRVRKFKTPQTWWVCTEGDDAMQNQLWETLLSYIPPSEIAYVNHGKGSRRVVLKNGSKAEMKSYAQSRSAYQGAKLDGILNDEEPPQHINMEQRTRLLDLDGTMVYTLTPIEGTMWLHDALHNLPKDRRNAITGRFGWYTGTIYENPYISEAGIAEYLQDFGHDEDMIRIRIGGEYVTLGGKSALDATALKLLWDRALEDPPMWGLFTHDGIAMESVKGEGWKIFEEAIPGMGYAIGVDPRPTADTQDAANSNTAASVWKVATGEEVATYAGQQEMTEFGYDLFGAYAHYNEAMLGIEINNHGGALQTQMIKMGVPHSRLLMRTSYSGRPDEKMQSYGWRTDGFSKATLINMFNRGLCDRAIRIHDRETIAELQNIMRLRKHEPGQHGYGAGSKKKKTDRAMASMIGWVTCQQTRAFLQAGFHPTMIGRTQRIIAKAMEQRETEMEEPGDFS